MKQTIKWHKECLKNMRIMHSIYEDRAAKESKRADRLREGIQSLLNMVEQAEKRGMDSFDAERFLVKRAKAK